MYENPYSENQKPEEEKPVEPIEPAQISEPVDEDELKLKPEEPTEPPAQPTEPKIEIPPIDTEQSAQPAQPEEPDSDSKLWATFCHLAAFSGYMGIPFGHILGPLIIWLIKKDAMPYVDQNGKEAVNFQISMVIYFLAAFPLICGGPLILLVWIPLAILQVIFVIIATIKANAGEVYKYPMSIRFIK